MEREKKYNLFYIVAIILLGIHTVYLLKYYSVLMHWRYTLEQASYIVLILGMVFKKASVLTVGAFLQVVRCLLNLKSATFYLTGKVTIQALIICGVVFAVLSCIAWVLFAVSTFKREKAVLLCTAGAIVHFVGAIATTNFALVNMLIRGIDIVFIIFCGILLQKSSIFATFTKKETVKKSVAFSDNPYEKALKLKELLELGVITQEEFDEKKKELLGL